MSQNTKTIAARIPHEQSMEILRDAAEHKMSKTDWLLLQIDIAKKAKARDEVLAELIDQLEEAFKKLKDYR